MSLFKKLSGGHGEEIAARYLAGQGYKIIARNVRSKFGEIDLVARHGRTLCFVEVKARRSSRFGWPEESVTPLKQHRLRRLAEWYLQAHRLSNVPVRFDVVSLILEADNSPARMRLIKSAF